MRKATAIIDLQFGSTGKGLIAGKLGLEQKPDTVICAFGPNAGHTFVVDSALGVAFKIVHTMLPISAVSPKVRTILIGPGAVISPVEMAAEALRMASFHHAYHSQSINIFEMLKIHANAAVVFPEHLQAEKVRVSIGSTMKGTGAAQVHKMARDPEQNNTAGHNKAFFASGMQKCIISPDEYDEYIDAAENVIIEGAQGFSLGINQRFYPYSTYRECTTAQLLSDVNWPLHKGMPEIVGTIRTFPIRVANRFNEQGEQIGTSGGHYPDQVETSFEAIGVPQELTTVTKLPRRVFTFSHRQVLAALRINAVDKLFVNFMNYLPKDKQQPFLTMVQGLAEAFDARLEWTGWGPKMSDVRNYDRF